MIYFIVTTSVFNDCPIRKSQYINGITKLKESIIQLNIENYKIIIVENNDQRETFLNDLECDVYYTANNFLPIQNKGYKELQDVFDCIKKYSINDTDFIVKMTGRYILHDNSEFMKIIQGLHSESTYYDCVIKYGSFYNPVNYKMNDCITGLIGMTCFYVKQINYPREKGCVEWKWAKVTDLINNEKICMVNKLGINICPGTNDYFLV
jgi:hypothetical protein